MGFKTVNLSKHMGGKYKSIDDFMENVKDTKKITKIRFKDRNNIDTVVIKYNPKFTINSVNLSVMYQM